MGSVLSSFSSSSPPPLPLPPSPPPEIKYDVFLSFRGDDTRNNFTSHLHKALHDNGIETFIDYKLRRGDEISPALIQAIEESQIAIIIFSEHYASSRWCLEELVKILECKKNHGQIVIPVFYEIDPSHVRNQTGTFAVAFASHQRRFKKNLDKVQKWRCALNDAANLSGFDSRVVKPESVLVKQIVEDALKRLNNMPPSDDNKKLVGIESRITKIELALGTEDQVNKLVCSVGIWGIGGIGKTTLARAVFDKIFCQFEGSYFVANVREALEKKDLPSLQRELYSAILRDENAYTYTFTKKRLSRKKLLIVFDDVPNFEQVEDLIRDLDCVGSGSRIIVTSRDQQVLKNLGVDYIFKVNDLCFSDALKLFCQYAFNQNRPKVDYKELSKCVVEMVGGVPLALKVLGSFLLGKEKDVWESSMKKLEKSLDKKIHEALKISYDGLDHYQQSIFLDIACFYTGWDINNVIAIMNASGFCTVNDISALIDKSLIFISFNQLMMHDLLQVMGKEIVRLESFDDPGKRSRLWDHEEINDILTNATGTEKIEGIYLDMSKSRDIYLNPCALVKMSKMRFLKISFPNYREEFHFKYDWKNKVHVLPGLQYVSAKLRYFHWDQYPLKSLQSNFYLNKLVILEMRDSGVEELWRGVQQFDHLKEIHLQGCKNLISIPNLSLAPNLELLDLSHCKNLTSIGDFSGCKSLKIIDLNYCSKLIRLSEIPSNLERIEFLGCKSLIELPSSFKHLNKVQYLNFFYCDSLTSIPDLRGWESLKRLHLVDCLKLKMLSKLPNSIEELYLRNSLIEELPMSSQDLYRLRILKFQDCTRLKSLPSSVCKWKSLEQLRLSSCPKVGELPNDLTTLKNLNHIAVTKTSIREVSSSILCLKSLLLLDISTNEITEIPDSLCCLTSLRELSLRSNNLKNIPESIINLSNLRELDISYCERLKVLPKLPWADIFALNCTSLEELPCPSFCNDFFAQNSDVDSSISVHLSNCYKLDRNSLDNFLKDILQNIEGLAASANTSYRQQVYGQVQPCISICYPKSEIPEWFGYQNDGSFIDVSLPKDSFNYNFLCFAVCVVVAFKDQRYDEVDDDDDDEVYFNVNYECKKKSEKGDHTLLGMLWSMLPKPQYQNDRSNHAIFGVAFHFFLEPCDNKFSFRFYGGHGLQPKIKKCGVHLVFGKHLEILDESEDVTEILDENDDVDEILDENEDVDEPNLEESDQENEPHPKRLKQF